MDLACPFPSPPGQLSSRKAHVALSHCIFCLFWVHGSPLLPPSVVCWCEADGRNATGAKE